MVVQRAHFATSHCYWPISKMFAVWPRGTTPNGVGILIKILSPFIALLLFAGAVTTYTIRAFHPEQPLHHELNQAAGVFLIAFIVWILLISFLLGSDD